MTQVLKRNKCVECPNLTELTLNLLQGKMFIGHSVFLGGYRSCTCLTHLKQDYRCDIRHNIFHAIA